MILRPGLLIVLLARLSCRGARIPCVDQIDDCLRDNLCERNKRFAAAVCPHTCMMCPTTEHEAALARVAHLFYNGDSLGGGDDDVAASQGLIKLVPERTRADPNKCVDLSFECNGILATDECTAFEPYNRYNCPRSCGFCTLAPDEPDIPLTATPTTRHDCKAPIAVPRVKHDQISPEDFFEQYWSRGRIVVMQYVTCSMQVAG